MDDERAVFAGDGSSGKDADDDMETEIEDTDDSDGLDGHVRSLLAGYALGTLDPEETESVARHIGSCTRCRAELAEYGSVTGLLPFAAPVHQVPLQARAGLLARVAELGTDNEEQMVALPVAPRATNLRSRFWDWMPRFPKLVGYGLAPALVLLVAVGVMNDRLDEQQEEIAQLQEEKARTSELLVDTDESVPSQPQEFIPLNTASNAEARLFLNEQRNAAMIVARNLPALGENEHYIVWLTFVDTPESARVGTLDPDDQGRAQAIIEPSGTLDRYQTVFITLEQEPEPAEPLGPQIMTAAIVTPR